MKTIEDLDLVRMNIQLTKKCNQKCISCYTYKMDYKNEMDTLLILKVVSDLCEAKKISNVAFTGGEPTIKKDFLLITKHASSLVPNVSVTTNGYMFNSKDDVLKAISSGIN